LPVRSAAGVSGAGADVARGVKGRQPTPGALRVPMAASQQRADAAPPHSQRFRRAALPKIAAQPRPGALRAPLKTLEKVLTAWMARQGWLDMDGGKAKSSS